MTNIRLTNETETFLLGAVIEDERGPVHAQDSRGSGYTRCDTAACDHGSYSYQGHEIWHDDENTETLRRVL